MKRKLSVLFILSVISISLFSQTNSLKVGVLAGAGIGNNTLHDAGFGYSGMLSCEYSLSEKYAIYTNLGYENKLATEGIILTDVYGDPMHETTIYQNFEFITIPVLFRINFGTNLKFFVSTGPSFNYLVMQSSVANDINLNVNNTGNFKDYEISVSLNGGVILPLNEKIEFSTEIRGNVGMNNLSEIAGTTLRTNSLQLLLGLVYKL